MSKHTIVWIDHKEAHIFRLQLDTVTDSRIHAPPVIHRHPKSDQPKANPDDTRRFFQEVAQSLVDAEGIVLVGPATAKLEFLRYVRQHSHLLEAKIIGIETVDHPTDRQIVAYANQYFNLGDRVAAL